MYLSNLVKLLNLLFFTLYLIVWEDLCFTSLCFHFYRKYIKANRTNLIFDAALFVCYISFRHCSAARNRVDTFSSETSESMLMQHKPVRFKLPD